MKECRAQASSRGSALAVEAFIDGAEWLSSYLASRRTSKGGKARNKALTPDQRKAIATKAAAARWSK